MKIKLGKRAHYILILADDEFDAALDARGRAIDPELLSFIDLTSSTSFIRDSVARDERADLLVGCLISLTLHELDFDETSSSQIENFAMAYAPVLRHLILDNPTFISRLIDGSVFTTTVAAP
jgi:hypothetical protein